jgi:hypothetical protein
MADQLMPGEWEAAGRGTSWGVGSGIFTQEAAKAKEAKYLADAVAMGNMDPRAAEGYYQGKLNRSIANGLGSLFGLQSSDPELRKANDLDAIFKTLSEDDLKNPAGALNKVADHLSQLGHAQEAINYRLKAETLAQDTITKKNASTTATLVQNEKIAKYIGSQANGTLEAFGKMKDRPELKKQFWDNYVAKYEQVAGKEEADKLRALPETAWEAQLVSDVNSAESAATTSMEQRQTKQIEASRDREVIKAGAVAAGVAARATAMLEKTDRELKYKYANLDVRKSQNARKDISDRVDAGDAQVKQMANDIEEVDKSLDNFRSKINFAGEDKEVIQAHIASLEAKKAIISNAKMQAEAANASFRKQFDYVIATNQANYMSPSGTSPAPQPPGIPTNYERYKKEFAALKGNTAAQKKLTDWARSNGIVK